MSTQSITTSYRKIQTPLPVPESQKVLERLATHEPRAMQGQPPILWDRAEGFQVHDRFGNTWIDLTSGVLVANTGHSPPEVVEAVRRVVDKGLLFNYMFATEVRADLVERLVGLAPAGLDKVFLLTTGAEAIEVALKIARTHGLSRSSLRNKVVHFENAFHGRTMGAQLVGGEPAAKSWIPPAEGQVQVPFPAGLEVRETGFDSFTKSLKEQGTAPQEVAAVIVESYQGGMATFAPVEYMRELRAWCDENEVLLIMDEVQAGFGRTGRMFAFEHYGITPDLVCMGKAISGSLPLAGVLGRAQLMDQFGPGPMSSTHGGNPIACAAALANLDLLTPELIERVREDGEELRGLLEKIARDHPKRLPKVFGTGFVYGLPVRDPATGKADPKAARRVVDHAFERGVLLFAPVGPGGATVKICPPLVTPMDALEEAMGVLEEAFASLEGST